MPTDIALEADRLKAVNRFLNLKISREKELEGIVSLAASVCESPVALITLIDKEMQYFISKTGIDYPAISPRKYSFCNHVLAQDGVFMVEDLKQDIRFADNPFIHIKDAFRFYAGAPLTTYDGEKVGSICVLDNQPKQLSPHQKEMLSILSRQVINLLEFELSLNLLKEQYMEAENTSNKLRFFFESSPASHALLDRNYEVITFNKFLYNFIHQMYNVKLYPGMKATDYMNRAYMRDFIRNFNKALAGESIVSDREISHPLAGNHWFRFNYNPAYDSEENIIGISWSATDINESKLHEQRILNQNEALRKIAYVQSHEFRKPVASILGLLNIIKMNGYGEHEECLKMIDEAANELDNTIKQIVYSTYPVLKDYDGFDYLKTEYTSIE